MPLADGGWRSVADVYAVHPALAAAFDARTLVHAGHFTWATRQSSFSTALEQVHISLLNGLLRRVHVVPLRVPPVSPPSSSGRRAVEQGGRHSASADKHGAGDDNAAGSEEEAAGGGSIGAGGGGTGGGSGDRRGGDGAGGEAAVFPIGSVGEASAGEACGKAAAGFSAHASAAWPEHCTSLAGCCHVGRRDKLEVGRRAALRAFLEQAGEPFY